jgi:hypothetical protein
MTDFENLDNIEACGECGTFHDARYCPMMEALYDDEAPFCELHPDTIPTQVRGVEGDDIGYECPKCLIRQEEERLQAKLDRDPPLFCYICYPNPKPEEIAQLDNETPFICGKCHKKEIERHNA